MKRFVYQILFPLTTAMIWGSSFVAQSESADHIGAFTFNAARCFAAFVALLLLLPLLRRLTGEMVKGQEEIVIPLRRCDHYRIRLEGSGLGGCGWTLHSLTRERRVGSNKR